MLIFIAGGLQITPERNARQNSESKAQAEVVAAIRGRDGVPIRHAAAPVVEEPTAPTNHAIGARNWARGARGIRLAGGTISTKPVLTPLPNVT